MQTMGNPEHTILPQDLLESQLAMIDLIRAMYPPSVDERDSSLQDVIERVHAFCDDPDLSRDATGLPHSISFMITIPIMVEGPSETSTPSIQMNINVPLASSGEESKETPPFIYSLRQPSWMSRAEVLDLGTAMPPGDVLAAVEHIQERAPKYLKTSDTSSLGSKPSEIPASGPMLRVWFYFPSLSTRGKRKDLVNYASTYSLTGFVLAGKPGILCLEGTSKHVDEYMNAIKNESWGDIPSHQKKVSERFREECGVEGRKFDDMKEITDDLGEKRGVRKNRGDMAALEAFLRERGVGDSFSKVVMGA